MVVQASPARDVGHRGVETRSRPRRRAYGIIAAPREIVPPCMFAVAVLAAWNWSRNKVLPPVELGAVQLDPSQTWTYWMVMTVGNTPADGAPAGLTRFSRIKNIGVVGFPLE